MSGAPGSADVILFESAAGYALFDVVEAEQIGANAPTHLASMDDYARFARLVHLRAMMPFKSSEDALDNINAISEGALPQTLSVFVEANVPTDLKLGVCEDKLASAIQDAFGIQCMKGKQVLELTRGIRLHFEKFVREFKPGDVAKAQLGLGHSYSRSKVKFNVNRADNMVIQAICLLDQLDKDVNTFSMRIREWYSWHFPELVSIVPDNYTFARCAKLISNKANLTDALLPKIVEITEDESKATQIMEAAKSSMGFEISELDMMSIRQFADRVIHLSEYRVKLFNYLAKKMHDIAPNLSALIGEVVGARLISRAGSLTNLAKYPASTVQILGAEKALFRALKSRGNTPKYGLIYHSSFIGKASARNKGRISRYLANKTSIASRIDSFSETQTSKFGEMLHSQVEERLKFYDTGVTPRKNIACMKAVVEELSTEDVAESVPNPKRKATPKKPTKVKEAMEVDEQQEEAVPAEEAAPEEAPAEEEEKPKVPAKKPAAKAVPAKTAPTKAAPAKAPAKPAPAKTAPKAPAKATTKTPTKPKVETPQPVEETEEAMTEEAVPEEPVEEAPVEEAAEEAVVEEQAEEEAPPPKKTPLKKPATAPATPKTTTTPKAALKPATTTPKPAAAAKPAATTPKPAPTKATTTTTPKPTTPKATPASTPKATTTPKPTTPKAVAPKTTTTTTTTTPAKSPASKAVPAKPAAVKATTPKVAPKKAIPPPEEEAVMEEVAEEVAEEPVEGAEQE
ncbi:Ribosome biogenesis protein:Nop56p/Sik1p [Pelomyxa schiedti]|nr:Ribosome biogenesis protein:Nop56p/Sik1p [Pelomyxa schiedti]